MTFRRGGGSSAHRLLALCALLLLLLGAQPAPAAADPAAPGRSVSTGRTVAAPSVESPRTTEPRSSAERPGDGPHRCSGWDDTPRPLLAPTHRPEPLGTPVTAAAAEPADLRCGTAPDTLASQRPGVPVELLELSVLRI
ncbi:hypothetical protein GL263_07830 [Streptomyces durbertensis]|uniref:Secreted protein n=1 Tax=Streptomyces durbertensis TaxID=2448886 RepID=A0ABR6EDQ7_9ACTN|nr:hypothetical protein [Streptomyces durbertensis]MBB1243470.1 hypothetical protein [Streptomyces durbertensis]